MVRFVISGSTATTVNLGTLFTLTHFFNIWYIYSSIAAFAISFFVSFVLQKVWTFEDRSRDNVHVQLGLFLAVILFALGLNTVLIYAFVEYMHTHYLVGQLVSGLFIAIINYFSYRHLVFAEKNSALPQGAESRSPLPWQAFAMVAISVLIFVSLALYRITETPPTWMDEGIIMQTSMNLAEHGIYGIQTSSDTFIDAKFLTTGFPVTIPVAVTFIFFGSDLLAARLVMVAFVALVCLLAYILIRALSLPSPYIAGYSLLLLTTFAPLYGHGKNMLGEVPGLAYLLAGLVALHAAERVGRMRVWFLAGLCLGLAMATKPSYLFIIVFSTAFTLLFLRARFTARITGASILGASMVLALWYTLNVGSVEALQQIFTSANAANVPLADRMMANAARLFTELQPAYFLGLTVFWWVSIGFRAVRKVHITSTEMFAAVFALANLILYLPSRGFYRYFFAGEALALLFLPVALSVLSYTTHRTRSFLVFATLCLLVSFQSYQTFFKSWVAEYRGSERAALLEMHLGALPHDADILLYNVPEAALFVPSRRYSQYLNFGENVVRGEENLATLAEGLPDFVLVDTRFTDVAQITTLYRESARFDKYTLYQKR